MFQVNIGEKFILGEGGVGIGTSNSGYDTLGIVISNLVPNILVIANIILFFFILFGGFTIITNAGNPDKQAEGTKTLTWAFVGFLIIFGAYWIMQILKIITGFDLLNSQL
ncbi:hypothetical protein GYA49_02365 [Candidatus Beckwithbacteria bacterium]|nr:hypothetical protein [Candidatus Beckwithbacteria bacterium]